MWDDHQKLWGDDGSPDRAEFARQFRVSPEQTIASVLGNNICSPSLRWGDIQRIVALSWEVGINPLPAFRKRLAPFGAAVEVICWAKVQPSAADCAAIEAAPGLEINASRIFFRLAE